MADLEALRGLYAWMRESRVLYARCGELELRLEPVALSSVALPAEDPPASDADAGQAYLEELLYSSGADPGLFAPLLRKRAA